MRKLIMPTVTGLVFACIGYFTYGPLLGNLGLNIVYPDVFAHVRESLIHATGWFGLGALSHLIITRHDNKLSLAYTLITALSFCTVLFVKWYWVRTGTNGMNTVLSSDDFALYLLPFQTGLLAAVLFFGIRQVIRQTGQV